MLQHNILGFLLRTASLASTNESSSSSTAKQNLQATKKFNPFSNYIAFAYILPGLVLPLHVTLKFLFAKVP